MNVDELMQRLMRVESSGRADAQGPWIKRKDGSQDRAYGLFQVMGANIPSWSQAHLGRRLTPAEFLADPEAQKTVARGQLSQYLRQTGSPADAASMWHSGRPLSRAQKAHDGYMQTPDYVQKVLGGGAWAKGAPKVMPGGAQQPQQPQMAAPAPRDDLSTMLLGLADQVKQPQRRPLAQKTAQQAPDVSKILGEGNSLVL